MKRGIKALRRRYTVDEERSIDFTTRLYRAALTPLKLTVRESANGIAEGKFLMQRTKQTVIGAGSAKPNQIGGKEKATNHRIRQRNHFSNDEPLRAVADEPHRRGSKHYCPKRHPNSGRKHPKDLPRSEADEAYVSSLPSLLCFLEEEKEIGYASPQFEGNIIESQLSGVYGAQDATGEGDHLSIKDSSQINLLEGNTSIQPTSSSQTTTNDANSISRSTKKVLVTDVECAVCKQLLYPSIVLNCGHGKHFSLIAPDRPATLTTLIVSHVFNQTIVSIDAQGAKVHIQEGFLACAYYYINSLRNIFLKNIQEGKNLYPIATVIVHLEVQQENRRKVPKLWFSPLAGPTFTLGLVVIIVGYILSLSLSVHDVAFSISFHVSFQISSRLVALHNV
ncbi:hypothetical protein SASPL_147282 [Salvia splendens]|uniref:Uncharacterized protein n=1 Tax=Salvia splendens TaxID=180675 RepID=A0A8X8WDN8_SALSN|nr:hypothetical protein SASPL_147282 [Salvia splendens]